MSERRFIVRQTPHWSEWPWRIWDSELRVWVSRRWPLEAVARSWKTERAAQVVADVLEAEHRGR